MKKVQWEMNEKFIFPEAAGLPTGAGMVKVTPRFLEEATEDAVRLKGIYHIAANVTFEEGEYSLEDYSKAILIDDVDLNEQMGYFEYAVPLNIDLPSEAGEPLEVHVSNARCTVNGQGVCEINWDVECSYKEIEVVEELVLDEVEEVSKAAVAILETSLVHDEDEVLLFLSELEDGVTSTIFRSNDVFVESKG
ncbi:hypothetical protein ACFSFY_04260 [Sporosarcina siberiensis]|uniref:DUF3794 domain-containing protein n=1 Tax=Sporosarcina siberiensis TaxID=1365606 RepID=A0ABW4SD19_9BACL